MNKTQKIIVSIFVPFVLAIPATFLTLIAGNYTWNYPAEECWLGWPWIFIITPIIYFTIVGITLYKAWGDKKVKHGKEDADR